MCACMYVCMCECVCIGNCTTTLPAILPDVCGKQNIARKQAVVLMFDGIGIIAGTPLVGL